MDLPKSKWEWLVEGSKFILRYPFLQLSYLCSRPINVYPLDVDMAITDRCNFRCKFCLGAVEDYEPQPEIDFTTMKRLINGMAEMHIPYLSLGGGEPFLRYDFFLQTVRYASQFGIRVTVVTNGSLLTEDKLVELVEAGLHRIAFSLDGANKETHDEIRMPGSFDNIMSDLALCQNLRRRKNFRLHLNTVIVQQNFRQLLDIAYIAKKFGATIFYQPVSAPFAASGRTLDSDSPVYPFIVKGENIDHLALEIKKLIDFKKRYGVVGNLIGQLSNIPSYFKSLEAGRVSIKFKCYVGFNTIQVATNGDFGFCSFFPRVANIQNIGLKEAWLSEEYNKQRQVFKQCRQLCLANCFYPVSLPKLTYEFLYLPFRRRLYSLFERGKG